MDAFAILIQMVVFSAGRLVIQHCIRCDRVSIFCFSRGILFRFFAVFDAGGIDVPEAILFFSGKQADAAFFRSCSVISVQM